MGIYTIFYMFENPRTCRQARNLTTKISKIVDLKSSSEQIFSEICRWVPPLKFDQCELLAVADVTRYLRVDFLKLAPSRDFETSSRAVKKL